MKYLFLLFTLICSLQACTQSQHASLVEVRNKEGDLLVEINDIPVKDTEKLDALYKASAKDGVSELNIVHTFEKADGTRYKKDLGKMTILFPPQATEK